jgi:hypothetical protein
MRAQWDTLRFLIVGGVLALDRSRASAGRSLARSRIAPGPFARYGL